MSVTEYGLIGHPLGHSLSPFIHEQIMASAGLTGQYHLIDIEPGQLADTVPVLNSGMAGYNCTIPFKEAVIPLLNGLDPSAARIRAVNTVWHGIGYNTDFAAFISNCPPLAGHRVMLLGAGGVSRTIAFAAAEAGADICIMARRTEQAEALAAAVWTANPACRISTVPDVAAWLETNPFDQPGGKPWVLINGTPLGMWPDVSGIPFPPDYLAHFAWVFDTIYNPTSTRLVLAARSRGVPALGGLGMLFDQALAAQKIWHPTAEFPSDSMQAIRKSLARLLLSRSGLNILLTGFMGSGKTATGLSLARQLGLPFIDLDQTIVEAAGKSIPEIFAESGEAVFRDLERHKLIELAASGQSQVLATGGGALIDPAAEAAVRKHPTLIICLDTPLDLIRQRVGSGDGRPLLSGQNDGHLEALFQSRYSRYISMADLRVDGSGTPENVAAVIAAELGY